MPSETIERHRAIANDPDRPVEQRRLATETVAEIMKYREALFRAAPSHQGGHSATGGAIADALGCSFPLKVAELEAKAREEKMDTKVLWPWLYRIRAARW